ncbi:ABC transporter permease, partial [Pantoea septica]|uniref:ABC transporter permease n=1 Tax=Pantoea septica TaxID=472695 RepID=UPI0028A59579
MTQQLSELETVRPRRRRRRVTSLTIGLTLVAILVLTALFAPLLAPVDPNLQTISARLLPPSAQHWFGTDGFGRDLLSRVIYGARPTLLLVSLILVLTIPVGLLVGITAGYVGGWTERVLMRITDIFLSLPNLVIALALVAMLGPGLMNGALALALTSWPPFARQARAETLALRRSDYLAAARMQGITGLRLMFGHILPLCLPTAVVRAALSLGGIILSAAGLGFLGMGVQPPTAEWGSMVAEGSKVIFDQWWGAAAP